MDGAPAASTRVSLLGRLQTEPDSPEAWAEFVGLYGPKVLTWCRRWNLQEADAQDVTQNVLLKLAVKLREFQYDPSRSFRAWLKTLAHHAWQDYAESQRRPGQGSGDSQAVRTLDQAEARDDLAKQLESAYDQELLTMAMARVRLRVEPHTWEAFHLLAVEGLSGAEAAARLKIKVATAFVARSKVQKMLQEEIHRLDAPTDEDVV